MSRSAIAALLLGALVVVAASGRVVAAPGRNTLTNGSVSPGSGSTTTNFVFSVAFFSPGGFAATSVVAVVASKTVPLTLVSGTDVNGTYEGSSLLPDGSWPVTFQATAAGRNDPILAGPTVVVLTPTPAPTPTLRPTPVPTQPAPTPSATPGASSGPPQPSASASEGTASAQPSPTEQPSGSALGAGSGSARATPLVGGGASSGGSLEGDLGTFLTGGLAAIGLLAVIGFTAIWRDRRREHVAGLAVTATPAAAAPLMPSRRRPSTWERDYAVQDEPIGTVEFDDPAPKEDPS